MNIKISKTNPTKMGKVWSISMPPSLSCDPDVPCRENGCYAEKAWRMYPQTRYAWTQNYELWKQDGEKFAEQLSMALIKAKKKPDLFRWFMAGDIPDVGFFKMMCALAWTEPAVKFLCFTKKPWLVQKGLAELIAEGQGNKPDNLSIVISAWPGMPLTRVPGCQVAWMQDGKEDRVPADAIPCVGRCDTCGMCWSLSELGRDVVFNLH